MRASIGGLLRKPFSVLNSHMSLDRACVSSQPPQRAKPSYTSTSKREQAV